jgi:hypothetical protein
MLPGNVATSTVWRWMTRGCRGHRLASIIISGSRCTTQDTIRDFFAAITAQADGQRPPLRTQTARNRAVSAANQRLDRAGA